MGRYRTKPVNLNASSVIQDTHVSLVSKHCVPPSMFVTIQKRNHILMENFVWGELMQQHHSLGSNHTITAQLVHQPSFALLVELFLNVPPAIFA